MKKQSEKLSYERLVTRTDFYKRKALELEKQVVFAKENTQTLEQQLQQLIRENGELKKESENKLAGLREMEQLEEEHRQVKEEWEKEKEATENELEMMKAKLTEKDKELNKLKSDGNEKKINDFEKLLSDVQVELNEKEALIDSYQKRIKSLEQRVLMSRNIPVNKVFAKKEETEQVERKVVAYFDYSIAIDEKKEAVIRGNFHIENVGSRSLGTPFVCFRFYPVDASALKGRILSLDKLSHHEGTKKPDWVFMDGEWGSSAKERGEIWVRPNEEWTLSPDESLTLTDFQIPVKKHYDENVIVEGFVYFQRDEYKQKAANQILISF
ncbi:MAG TPA: hypothetical protein VFK37_02375 [Bacillales bacterium]|nr:hypothetical protein [Bacillales bacterium]